MLTINTILREMKEVPVSRLEEVYQFIHSMTPKSGKAEKLKKKILAFGGLLNEMSNEDYSDFLSEMTQVRKDAFSRKSDL